MKDYFSVQKLISQIFKNLARNLSLIFIFAFCPAFSVLAQDSKEKLEIRLIELDNCIQLYRPNEYVIRDEEAYLKAVRHDAGRERCLKNTQKINFDKYSLLGIEINSGYCRYPLGLAYQAINDTEKKRYQVSISYIDPGYSVCRALSRYDLWLVVPKIPENYEVVFEVKARMAGN